MKTIKIKKTLACLLTASCLFSSMNTVAFADDSIVESYIGSDYGVYSLYTGDYSSTLTISGTTALCHSEATRNSYTKQIEGDMYLEKYVSGQWTAVDAWRLSVTGMDYSNTKTKSGLSSGKYRVKTEFYVTSTSGGTETLFAYSESKYVS